MLGAARRELTKPEASYPFLDRYAVMVDRLT
jgi:hypothetical protein